jgi:flagellar basal-body rod modification protein FlgD
MPSTNPITATAILPPGNVVQNPVAASSAPQNTLTQNDFLKLLVAQMSAQDPLNPVSNTDFAAQMAQFSALQTSQATQSDMSLLQASQQVQQANGLIGRSVVLQATDGTQPSGVVSGIQMVSGVPKIVVNGSLYDMGQVLSISATQVTQTPTTPGTPSAPVTPSTPTTPYAPISPTPPSTGGPLKINPSLPYAL